MDIVTKYLHNKLQELNEILKANGLSDQQALEAMQYHVTVALRVIENAPKA